MSPHPSASETPSGPGAAGDDRLDIACRLGHLATWERDRESGAGRWDAAVFDLYGMPRSDAPPPLEAALQFIHPADRAAVRSTWLASLRQPGVHEQRYRVIHPERGEVHLRSVWEVPATGSRIVGVLFDETELMRRTRAQDAALMQLRMISSVIGLSMWRTDLATQRVTNTGELWSAPWNVTGMRAGEQGVTASEAESRIHPEDRAAAAEAARQALAGDGPATALTRYRRPDGSYRRLLTQRSVERDAAGQPVAMLGIAVDMTELSVVAEQYRELRERYELAISSTGTGVWSRDMRSGAREWNDEMRALHGLRPEDPLPGSDHGVIDFVLEEDRHLVRAAMDRVWLEGRPMAEATYRIRRVDGEVRTLLGRVRRMADKPDVIIGIVLDLTDLHEAQRAQRERAAAEAGSRAKSEFLSRISHELRTPLNAVIGFSSLLADDPGRRLDATQREFVDHIQQAGRHLLALVNDLLEVGRQGVQARADAGARCRLDAVVADVIAWHADAAREAGLVPVVEGQCADVAGDERSWRQIVTNLVSNAIKYNRPGGRLQLTLRDRLDGPQGPRVELEVHDGGAGLDDAQQAHLFEPFNRLGAERRGIPGTGLGLSITRQLVLDLGGEIEVDSRVGEGSTMRVSVPPAARAAAPAQRAEPTPPPAPEAVVADIVYVEDNAANVLLVREILRLRPQLRLHVAGSVAEALPLVRRVKPALLLVDLHLPDGDGHDLMRMLRDSGGCPAAHCIAVSAQVMHDDVARAADSGFEAHWAKPIDVGSFLDGVDRLLGQGPHRSVGSA